MNAIFIEGDEASDAIRDTYNALVGAGRITHSVDAIPYTEDFECLYGRIREQYPMTRREVFNVLMNHRKRGECQAPSTRNKTRPSASV